MKKYFATSLHDDEWTALQFMTQSSVPVPVYLAADLKPDARDGRCACVWSGDRLATVCLAHIEAVRDRKEPTAEQWAEIIIKAHREFLESQ